MLHFSSACCAGPSETRWLVQELSAAQKKRLKKKAKKKDEPGDEEAPEAAAKPGKKDAKKAPGGKPVSAAVRKIQEEVERRRAAEEAAAAAEAERVRKVCMLVLAIAGLVSSCKPSQQEEGALCHACSWCRQGC